MLSLEYVAGLFDGEGCVSVQSKGYLAVVIANNHLPLLQQLKEQFGGSITIRPNGTCNWKISTRQGEAFLRLIHPFLVVKKDVAQVGILLSSSSLSEREHYRMEIHRLNRITTPHGGPRSRYDALKAEGKVG